MANINEFFTIQNTVRAVSDTEKEQTSDYLECIRAFSKITYMSIYVIDYEKKGFEYVSDNPLFLCGHTAKEVQELGYAFYFKYVTPEDLDLLLKINNAGFSFYEDIPFEERKDYTISYDFHLKNQNGNVILINQKLTPLFLTNDGKIWKALCIISLSNEQSSGNVKISKKGSGVVFHYNIEKEYWKKVEETQLTSREKEILLYSTRGYTIKEIADAIFVSTDTVKFHRRKVFNKLEVANIAEAIAFATNNKLI